MFPPLTLLTCVAFARIVARNLARAPRCGPEGARQDRRRAVAEAMRDLVPTNRRGRLPVVGGVVLLLIFSTLCIYLLYVSA